ncbi:MAG: alpha-amylase family glycosyl hydrolase [Bacteroidota bacterium]
MRKVEPPNWWSGMVMKQVQLMIHGTHLTGLGAYSESPQIRVVRIYRTPDPSYAFVDIEIAEDALEGYHRITLTGAHDSVSFAYPILHRRASGTGQRGFDAGDVIYLITPDRFANGDTTNDTVSGMTEARNRHSPLGRHGGDLKGIIDHLDYLSDLGVSALWINPLVENNMPAASYHGYAATDLYTIDPRFGTNALYEELVREAHRRGLKVIMDHVSNHVGIAHPWMKDLPSADWLNGSASSHLRVSHDLPVLTDVHMDSTEGAAVVSGWFSDNMPDLNQRNSFVARYLTQNTIWWIESTGIDGIREDTYPYADQRFLAEWARAIFAEYPAFSIVGEVWIGDPAFVAPYQKGSPLAVGGGTNLPSVTDFPLFDAFTEVFGNRGSIRLIYDGLSKDHLYADPYALMTFVDNHDTRRIMYLTEGDSARALLALTLLLTTRGIPQIYYGTEIGLMGGRSHGAIRADFPGGFPGDTTDAFTVEGRVSNSMFTSLRRILHLRKQRPSLAYGRLVHFPPVDEAYVYLRALDDEQTMIIVNNKNQPQRINLAPYRHGLAGATRLRDLITGGVVDIGNVEQIEIGGNTAGIYAVMRDSDR